MKKISTSSGLRGQHLVSAALILALCLTVTGCGGAKPAAATPSPQTSASAAVADADAALTLLSNAVPTAGTQGFLPTGEDTVGGEHCWTFSFGDNTEEKFTATAHYAVGDSGTIYEMDVAAGGQYAPIKISKKVADNTLAFISSRFFTDTTSILTDNNSDGTYRYEDMTADGMTVIVNTATRAMTLSGEDDVDGLNRIIIKQGDGSDRLVTIKQSDEFSRQLGRTAYSLEWTSGYNEDTRAYLGVAAVAGDYAYLYYFSTTADNMAEMRDTFIDNISGLTLTEP